MQLRTISLLAPLVLGSLLPLAARAAPPQSAIPDRHGQAILIYTALMALDQANTTGNYSVLRDLAAPEFQTATSSAALAEAFAGYRRMKVALAPAVLYEPHLAAPAAVAPDGTLRLQGYMPTRPLRINFDLTFREVAGSWRLIAVAISPTQSGKP
jgi:hypothetical protein